jgi:hypothetical protein
MSLRPGCSPPPSVGVVTLGIGLDGHSGWPESRDRAWRRHPPTREFKLIHDPTHMAVWIVLGGRARRCQRCGDLPGRWRWSAQRVLRTQAPGRLVMTRDGKGKRSSSVHARAATRAHEMTSVAVIRALQMRRGPAFALVMGLWWACQDLNLGPHPYQGSAPGPVSAGSRLPPARTTYGWRPLETVANRSDPMACGPNVDQARLARGGSGAPR